MSLRPATSRLARTAVWSCSQKAVRIPLNKTQCSIRLASTDATIAAAQADLTELEQSSALDRSSSPTSPGDFDPVARARSRKRELPPSRYQFRPPRYYRGPLHPHQPPPPTDIASRAFVPGPFTAPALEQTYHATLAADLMTLSYHHFPPGYTAPPTPPRLRSWDDSSPYHAGRPLRGPRGGSNLRPLRRPITFRNIPALSGITVHAFVAAATEDSAALHIAGMALQAVTGARATAHKARKSVPRWGLRPGKFVAVSADLTGEDMYHFLAKCVTVVLPRVRDWRGVKGTSGDSSGNIAFGLSPEAVALFPEIEVNYDAYPPKLIPGCHVIIRTTAKSDSDARMLLTAMGLPFYGKLVD